MIGEVVSALQQRGAHFEVVRHSRAYDGMQEAIALGLAPDDVLKAVLLETRAGHVLAVLPASRRLDMRLVREACAARKLSQRCQVAYRPPRSTARIGCPEASAPSMYDTGRLSG